MNALDETQALTCLSKQGMFNNYTFFGHSVHLPIIACTLPVCFRAWIDRRFIHMWSELFIAATIGLVFLYIPGYFAARGLQITRGLALGLAPLLSLFAYSIWAIAAYKIGIFATWKSIGIPVVVAGFVVFVAGMLICRFVKGAPSHIGRSLFPERTWLIASLILVLVFGIGVTSFAFLQSLDGPASYVAEYDNLSHMMRIKTAVTTGNYAPFGLDYYPELASGGPDETHSSGFYPSTWHMLAYFMVSMTAVEIPIAVNATNLVFLAFVAPLSAWTLLSVVFREKKWALLACSFLPLAFVAFPWGMILFGPLYPNMAAFSMVLGLLACLYVLSSRTLEASCERVKHALPGHATSGRTTSGRATSGHAAAQAKSDLTSRILLGIAFLGGLGGLALSHPNAFFALAVPAAYLLAQRAYEAARGFDVDKTHPWLPRTAALAVLALALICWFIAYKTPFMSAVVSNTWIAFTGKSQALFNLALLSLRDMPIQPVLAALVLIGALESLHRREYLWMGASWATSGVMYVINAGSDGWLKHFLTGFWYTDHYRVAALVALMALPLAALGLITCLRGLRKLLAFLNEKQASSDHTRPYSLRFGPAVLTVFVFAAIFYPSITVFGPKHQTSNHSAAYTEVQTAFGYINKKLTSANKTTGYTAEINRSEREFLEEVAQIVPEGALIINEPHDGSAFAYVLYDLNVYYRTWGSASGDSQTSSLIRNKLYTIASDKDVQDAVAQIDAKYLLLLDSENDSEHMKHATCYDSAQWQGLERITDETPGFKLILSRDDMKLYEIVSE